MQITPHWTDADLAAALDPSGGGERGVAARAHAQECAECAAALEEMRVIDASVARVLQTLDHPMPPVDLARVTARGRVDHGSNRRPLHRMRWGLGALFVGLAAVAAAMPQSPVRQLLAHIFVPHSQPAVPATSAMHALAMSGPQQTSRSVAIVPDGEMTVYFRSVQTTGAIRIIPTRGNQVTVKSDGDGATYTVGQDRILVEHDSTHTPSYDVDIPPVAKCPTVRVRVGDRVVYSRTLGHVQSLVAPDAHGWYVIEFTSLR